MAERVRYVVATRSVLGAPTLEGDQIVLWKRMLHPPLLIAIGTVRLEHLARAHIDGSHEVDELALDVEKNFPIPIWSIHDGSPFWKLAAPGLGPRRQRNAPRSIRCPVSR